MTSQRKDQLRKRIELEELQRRADELENSKILANIFLDRATQDIPWQKEVIQDPSTHKALFGERRGAKSTLMGIAAIYKALTTPYAKILYAGLTQDSCQRVMYDEVLSRLKRKYNLPAKLIGNDQMVFDNGSIIYLVGVNSNKEQKEKVRGFKASLILIDEMQSYTRGIGAIIEEILGPTAADTKATMIIGGTAGNALGKNYWYEITQDNRKDNPIHLSKLHPEWKVWRCSWENNTAIDEITGNRVCDNVRDYLSELLQAHPGKDQTDSWRQEWNAEWILRRDTLIYNKFTEANLLLHPSCVDFGTNQRIEMPNAVFLASARYILGMDIGSVDKFTLVVLAYNIKYSNKLYVVESFGKSGMLVPEMADKMRSLDDFYHFEAMVGDSSNLVVFDTLNQTYGLNIQKADRYGKQAHQLIINSDFQTRSIIFLPGNEELVQELQTLTWDPKYLFPEQYGRREQVPQYKELDSQHNDFADALLYAHHFSRHRWYTAPKPVSLPLDPSGFNAQLVKNLFQRNRPQSLFDTVNFALPNRRRRTR